jgi:hypothetical protein
MKNIPEKIYLNIGEDHSLIDDFNDLSDVTWCQDQIDDKDIEYVRVK